MDVDREIEVDGDVEEITERYELEGFRDERLGEAMRELEDKE